MRLPFLDNRLKCFYRYVPVYAFPGLPKCTCLSDKFPFMSKQSPLILPYVRLVNVISIFDATKYFTIINEFTHGINFLFLSL